MDNKTEYSPLGFFLQTVSTKFEQDASDVESFCFVLEALIFGGEFQLSWDLDPGILANEAIQWSFELILPDSEAVVFFMGIADDHTASTLWADLHYMDITSWVDKPTLEELKISYTMKEGVDPYTGEPLTVRLVDNPIGIYSDPCRPCVWLLTPEYLGKEKDTITVQEVTLGLIEKWKKFLVGDTSKEKLRPKNKFKLVSKDGNLIDPK